MIKIRAGLFALPVLGLLAMAPKADAAQKLIPAANCDNFNANEANDIDRLVFGVRTLVNATRYVVCSLPRELTVAGGTVVVNGQVFPGSTMYVTVYAENNLGSQTFAAKSVSPSPTANFQTSIPFTQQELPSTALLTVLVGLPANGGGYYTSTSMDH